MLYTLVMHLIIDRPSFCYTSTYPTLSVYGKGPATYSQPSVDNRIIVQCPCESYELACIEAP